jgi:hypothetical protein
LDRSWGRRGARRRGSAAPPCAGRGSDCSGEVGGAPATGGGRWATVGAMGGGGSLGWVCSRPELGARRGCLQWRRQRLWPGRGALAEGPKRPTREGGSEWEPIKILLEGDRNSNKMNTASDTRLRLTTQIGHVATTFRPENASKHQTLSPLTNTGQTGEHNRSDRCNTPVSQISARKPQNTKQANLAPNRPKLETAATQDNREHTQTFT